MAQLFEFEKPIAELEQRILELRKFSADKGIDLSQEVSTLEKKVLQLKKEIYGNLEPWQKVQIARHSERPNFYDYSPLLFEDFIELKGDRLYADDRSIAGGIALFHGIPVTVVAQVKGKDTKENIKRNFGMPHPEGYRKAVRLMDQAEKFGRPILTFIDTPGAACDLGAEERGQGEAIARCLLAMSGYHVPVISTVIGEGGSGGALALGVGNVLLMLENSFYSVIAPESCASILWKDPGKAKEAAAALKFTAQDLLSLGVADELVREPQGGAHNSLQQTAEELSQVIAKHLIRLRSEDPEVLCQKRYEKLRAIGAFQETSNINLTKTLD
ncbi:acetyl-CoA carboxylase, carboxyl transferase, alpha subunit [Desulfosporosinus orientis DSM 765]|uniref:Acetyl-coenzyme A carboxylase carboxyl transferase subunit alpha n=1 Tax=Desulfosporosinus orientis (strain ATCC 19365 / DSM 765 / NCIMB 8382 / VKM B-1628 / Singapore I) TaxID=768706 RepID=G7WIM5_DESOD|nr:acetyl-CoA carboxylase carboxyltransferase subunit alpha [Desulfosporosinus orientis]AET69099.1 acetyl-CoA carboxylase, carboxyl transferase, alpha subunit [Desulfosporosinus orientis DSM 765]